MEPGLQLPDNILATGSLDPNNEIRKLEDEDIGICSAIVSSSKIVRTISSGWWLNQPEKYARQIGFIFPKVRVEHKKYEQNHHLVFQWLHFVSNASKPAWYIGQNTRCIVDIQTYRGKKTK